LAVVVDGVIPEFLLDSSEIFRGHDRRTSIEAYASPGSSKRSDRLFLWGKKKRSFTIVVGMT